MTRCMFGLGLLCLAASAGCEKSIPVAAPPLDGQAVAGKVVKTDEEWKAALSADQYYILRHQGTERAFSGKYYNTKTPGVYQCAGCDLALFDSEHKFESDTGWPSFDRPIDDERVTTRQDATLFMIRNEILCSRCDGHLGHLFDDGPPPTGLRYCINSAGLKLVERAEASGGDAGVK